ncbi:MAG: hypothetical protein ACE5E5_09460 [Phycisphaerae bacterium]
MAKNITAAELRDAYRLIPKEIRQENQGFSIRVWRALSWLDRAESIETLDHEGRFISFWICFNALYGQLVEDGHAWGDREAWNAFLSRIWRIDEQHTIRKAMGKRQI